MRLKNTNTKDALIKTAYILFAERGYDDVSIAEIASELGVTKQALLHHFGSKEKLYGHVLAEMSERFDKIIKAHAHHDSPPLELFRRIIRDLYRHMLTEKHDARLIMRELLDNKPRIADKQRWYLRPFLETLAELVRQIEENRTLTNAQAFARTYQIMGAVNYFAISDPTLVKMFGEAAYDEMEAVFLEQLELLYLNNKHTAETNKATETDGLVIRCLRSAG